MAVRAPLFRPHEDSLRAYANATVQAFMGVMDGHVAAVPEIAVAPLSFEEFFEAERSRLFRALVLITYDVAEAEDLTQEAFVRVLERWERIAQTDDPVAYLFRTAMNLHRSALRRAVAAAKLLVPAFDGGRPVRRGRGLRRGRASTCRPHAEAKSRPRRHRTPRVQLRRGRHDPRRPTRNGQGPDVPGALDPLVLEGARR